ncbi:hypothetical protein DFO52_1163 [Enterobacter sp. AG326]|nr:hypothetical protein DFO52_1163 [Enterobacter sp. AG326]
MRDDLLEHINRIEDNIAEYDRLLSHMAKLITAVRG